MNVDRIAEIVESFAPEQVLDTVLVAKEGARACLTSSFQAEDMALLHLLRKRVPDVPVLFLDTGYHFPQTYEYRDRMAKEWSLHLVNVLPSRTVPDAQESQEDRTPPSPHGQDLVEGEPPCGLELGTGLELRECEWHQPPAPIRRGLSQHWVPALYRASR